MTYLPELSVILYANWDNNAHCLVLWGAYVETNPSKALGPMPGARWGLRGVRFPPYSSPSGVSGVGAACGESLRSAYGSSSRSETPEVP